MGPTCSAADHLRNRLRVLIGFVALSLCAFSAAADMDGDGIDDAADNCSMLHNPDQRDSNADGFGNACDMDLNNDNVVNVVDLGLLRVAFFTDDADADSNGDGVVNAVDLGALRSLFLMPPGPGTLEPVYTQRVVRADIDNVSPNASDSVVDYTFFPDGSLSLTTSTRVPSNPDDPPFDDVAQTQFSYTPEGLVQNQTTTVQSGQSEFSSTTDVTYIDGRVVQTDNVFEQNGTMIVRRSFWNYANGAPRTIDRYRGASLETLELEREGQRLYDAQGRPSLQLEVPVDPTAEFTQMEYVWNIDGSLQWSEDRRTRNDVVTRLRTKFYVHADSRLVETSRFDFSDVDPSRTEAWFYDEEGRLSSVEFDFDADGAVDTIFSYTWEEGPCRTSINRAFEPTSRFDGRLDSGLTNFALCHP